jgi:hypothetical protein
MTVFSSKTSLKKLRHSRIQTDAAVSQRLKTSCFWRVSGNLELARGCYMLHKVLFGFSGGFLAGTGYRDSRILNKPANR